MDDDEIIIIVLGILILILIYENYYSDEARKQQEREYFAIGGQEALATTAVVGAGASVAAGGYFSGRRIKRGIESLWTKAKQKVNPYATETDCRCNGISQDKLFSNEGNAGIGKYGPTCNSVDPRSTGNKRVNSIKEGRTWKCITNKGACSDGQLYSKPIIYNSNYDWPQNMTEDEMTDVQRDRYRQFKKSGYSKGSVLNYPSNTFELSGNACKFQKGFDLSGGNQRAYWNKALRKIPGFKQKHGAMSSGERREYERVRRNKREVGFKVDKDATPLRSININNLTKCKCIKDAYVVNEGEGKGLYGSTCASGPPGSPNAGNKPYAIRKSYVGRGSQRDNVYRCLVNRGSCGDGIPANGKNSKTQIIRKSQHFNGRNIPVGSKDPSRKTTKIIDIPPDHGIDLSAAACDDVLRQTYGRNDSNWKQPSNKTGDMGPNTELPPDRMERSQQIKQMRQAGERAPPQLSNPRVAISAAQLGMQKMSEWNEKKTLASAKAAEANLKAGKTITSGDLKKVAEQQSKAMNTKRGGDANVIADSKLRDEENFQRERGNTGGVDLDDRPPPSLSGVKVNRDDYSRGFQNTLNRANGALQQNLGQLSLSNIKEGRGVKFTSDEVEQDISGGKFLQEKSKQGMMNAVAALTQKKSSKTYDCVPVKSETNLGHHTLDWAQAKCESVFEPGEPGAMTLAKCIPTCEAMKTKQMYDAGRRTDEDRFQIMGTSWWHDGEFFDGMFTNVKTYFNKTTGETWVDERNEIPPDIWNNSLTYSKYKNDYVNNSCDRLPEESTQCTIYKAINKSHRLVDADKASMRGKGLKGAQGHKEYQRVEAEAADLSAAKQLERERTIGTKKNRPAYSKGRKRRNFKRSAVGGVRGGAINIAAAGQGQ